MPETKCIESARACAAPLLGVGAGIRFAQLTPVDRSTMPSKRSLVHPKFKTEYRVANWSDYDRSLAERGNITLWLSPQAMATWNAKPTRRRGGQRKYSDLAIETALTLRMLDDTPISEARSGSGVRS